MLVKETENPEKYLHIHYHALHVTMSALAVGAPGRVDSVALTQHSPVVPKWPCCLQTNPTLCPHHHRRHASDSTNCSPVNTPSAASARQSLRNLLQSPPHLHPPTRPRPDPDPDPHTAFLCTRSSAACLLSWLGALRVPPPSGTCCLLSAAYCAAAGSCSPDSMLASKVAVWASTNCHSPVLVFRKLREAGWEGRGEGSCIKRVSDCQGVGSMGGAKVFNAPHAPRQCPAVTSIVP